MPVFAAGVSRDRTGRARLGGGVRFAFRHFPLDRDPPARARSGRPQPRRPRSKTASGTCTSCSFIARRRSKTRICSGTPCQLGLDIERFDRDRAGAEVLATYPSRRRERTGVGRGAGHTDPVHRRRRAPRRLRRGDLDGGIEPDERDLLAHRQHHGRRSCPTRSPAARTASRSAERGCTCACASPAATSPAATARRTGTPPPTPRSSGHPIVRSAEPGEDWSWCYLDNVAFVASETMTLPELHLADWRPTKDTLHLYAQIVGKIRLATTRTAQPLVERPPLRRRPRAHDAAPASSRDDVRDQARLPRSRPRRADRRRAHQVVRARRRDARRGLRRPTPRDARRARHRRRDQGAAVRRPDDDAVSPGHRARVVGSRGDRALRPHPRLVGLGVRGVQRLVQRQDEPGAPLLARPRPRRHSLLGPTRRRRSTPIPSPRRRTRTRSSRSASGRATTPSATPPTTPTPRPSPRGSANSRCPRGAGSSTAPARWRCFPTRPCAAREIQERRCSRSARAPTRPALALPAGTPPASNRNGVRPPGS